MSRLIYIADDDKDILNLVKMFLVSEGYEVEAFSTGDELFTAFENNPSDLVILDIMMPGTDGLTICNRLRAVSDVPIIMLTAKDSDLDYVAGITLGGDDYLTKPFRPTVLTMRVKALLRRVEMTSKSKEVEDVVCGDLRLSLKGHCVYCKDKELGLTSTEFDCMSVLMAHFEEAVSRETLLDEVWGYDKAVETRVTDETIRRIRKKLKTAGSKVGVHNKWGYGYKLSIIEEQSK